jgi:hypothetical protein
VDDKAIDCILTWSISESAFGSRAPVLSPFKKIKIHFYKLSKNLKTILEIFSDTSHKHAKSQPEIRFILWYTKIIKSDMFWRFENVLLRSTLLSFLCSSKYKVFEIDDLHVCGIRFHANIFF